jgi:diguanylate cyclase (GGDEF)-like protein
MQPKGGDRAPASSAFRRLALVVAAPALAVAVPAAIFGTSRVGDDGVELALFAAFVVLGELLPIRIPREDGFDEVTLSSAFALATLLEFGLAPAIVVYSIGSVIGDLAVRLAWEKAVFNAAQYALSLGAAAGVLALTAGGTPIGSVADELLAVLAAGLVMFVVNHVLTALGTAVLTGTSIELRLRSDLGFQVLTAAALLALAPMIVAAADATPWLVPITFLPMLAIYFGGRLAAANAYTGLHDELTGLPNRELLRHRVQQAVARARESGGSVAVMRIDLDDLSDVIDTLGHQQGDLLLVRVPDRLTRVLSKSDVLARLGGAEFAVVIPGLAGVDAAVRAARRVAAAFEQPFGVGALEFEIGISVGIACAPLHGDDPSELIQRADAALNRAKQRASRIEVFAAEHDRHSLDRLRLAGRLGEGIDRGELVVHYQPKFDARSGAARGAEALVRWRHPELGLLPPQRFVPLAEHTGLIRRLTACVLEEAVGQCLLWRAAGMSVSAAVNLSARSLLDPGLVPGVRDTLERHGLPGSALTLEITESELAADTAAARAVLQRLREVGVDAAIDDFGTGYSSLSQLRRLPVAEIKIDKSFVRRVGADPDDDAIVRSVLDLGRQLGLRVTAEGVETEAARRRLAELGCDLLQGFHLARPMPGDQCLRAMLAGHPVGV